MVDTTVYFATNRTPDATAPGGYGAGIVDPADPGQVLYAVVPVTGIDLSDETSGTIGEITAQTQGNFAETVQAEIATTGKNLLVFIHGFDNSFADAIKRAAFNREWFAASRIADADTTVLAFTWPSGGTLFASLPNPPDAAYLADQAQAGKSCVHLAAFLRNTLALVAQVHRPGKRAFLLAHSMGNHALSCAVASYFAANPADVPVRFDEAILAAADEVNTTLQNPGTAMYNCATWPAGSRPIPACATWRWTSAWRSTAISGWATPGRPAKRTRRFIRRRNSARSIAPRCSTFPA